MLLPWTLIWSHLLLPMMPMCPPDDGMVKESSPEAAATIPTIKDMIDMKSSIEALVLLDANPALIVQTILTATAVMVDHMDDHAPLSSLAHSSSFDICSTDGLPSLTCLWVAP